MASCCWKFSKWLSSVNKEYSLLVFLYIMVKILGMGSTSVTDLIEASSGVHFSGLHMDSLKKQNGHTKSLKSETENFHKQPFVIGKSFHALHA